MFADDDEKSSSTSTLLRVWLIDPALNIGIAPHPVFFRNGQGLPRISLLIPSGLVSFVYLYNKQRAGAAS